MKTLRWVLVLVFVIAFVACTVSERKDLTGTWQKEDGSATIMFAKDGKVKLCGGAATIKTSFKVQDKEHLQMDLGIFGMGTLKYVLSKDSLAITDPSGNVSKYTRVKEVKEGKPQELKPQAQAPKAEAPKQEASKPETPKPEAPRHQ
ncbi:MAG: hypothetical protein ABFD97_25395 [Syntrophobacter sp.]